MLDTNTDRKNADADRNILGQKMNSFMKDYFEATDQNDLRDIFGELGTVAELKPLLIAKFEQKFLKPDMLKRMLRESKLKRRIRRRITSNTSLPDKSKGMYNIADNNKDAFLGRSMGRKTKYDAKNVDEQVKAALKSKIARKI
jgi:hypothetical protein